MPENLYLRGDKWYGRYFIRGELQRVSLRTSDLREAKARLKAIRLKAERQAFGLHAAARWEDAVAAYGIGVLDAGGLRDGTAKRYRVSLRQLTRFEGKLLPAITVQDISDYVEWRQTLGATNATIRRDLTTLSRVLAFARSKGMVQVNPVDAYDRSLIRERRAPIRVPTPEAIAAAVTACGLAGRPQLGALIVFLRANGMRAGEALRARWSDLDGDALTIHETKSGRARTIHVAPDSLPAKRGVDGRLFPGAPEDAGALASAWQWIRRDMPPERRFRIHDLRHAYAIAELRNGRDIYDLSHHLGHSSVKVTEIYLGYVPGKQRSSPRGGT
jgi:integrase